MTAGRRDLNLNAYLRNSGYHEAAWRVSPADPASVLDPRYSIDLAMALAARYADAVFTALADISAGAAFRQNRRWDSP